MPGVNRNAPADPGQAPGRPPGTGAIPDLLWMPVTAGLLILLPGVLGLLLHQPWLFPSLGPTAFLQTVQPRDAGSRLYNAIVGHLIGMAAGYGSVLLLAVSSEPSVLGTKTLDPPRLCASVLGIAVMLLLQLLTHSLHAPGAATLLLITLGGFRARWWDASVLLAGVLIVSVAGEFVRRLRLTRYPPR